jgi:hypothetical protein
MGVRGKRIWKGAGAKRGCGGDDDDLQSGKWSLTLCSAGIQLKICGLWIEMSNLHSDLRRAQEVLRTGPNTLMYTPAHLIAHAQGIQCAAVRSRPNHLFTLRTPSLLFLQCSHFGLIDDRHLRISSISCGGRC